MEVLDFVAGCLILETYPLLNHTAVHDDRTLVLFGGAVLKLGNTEQGGICTLEPTHRLHNSKIVGTRSTCGLLCHTQS